MAWAGMNLKDHKIPEWVGLEGTLKIMEWVVGLEGSLRITES